ncbi:MAG TPA: hypothetical protein VGE29_19065 [Prosthecobacter sp.]
MSNNRSGALFPMLAMGGVGLFALASILLTEGNTIGEFCRYLLVAGFLLSVVAPRAGFFVWLALCGYNDLLKRLMIMGGRVSHADLPFVLGITPAMFGGVVVALLLGGLLGGRRLMPRDFFALLAGGALMAATGGLALAQKGGMNGVLQALANNGLYALLLFVLPLLFRTAEDLQRLWRFLIFAFLPVAVYGVVQQVNGFSTFEVEYLRTGLSIEGYQLASERVRAFSTLNSPSALSAVCAFLAVMSLHLGFVPREKGQPRLLPGWLAVLCFIAHFAGLVASTSRTPLLLVPAALFGGWCFYNRGRTRMFYFMAVGGFLLLVLSSSSLINNLETVTRFLDSLAPSDSFVGRMVVVGTYWDRLEGFATVLMNPEAYTLFGWGISETGEGRFHYHDPLSEVLVRFGSLALLFLLVMAAVLLQRSHSQAWRLHQPKDRRAASQFIALAFALIAVSAISGSILTVFPNNVFFWMSLAGVAALARQQSLEENKQRSLAAEDSPAAVPDKLRPLRPRSRRISMSS